MAEEFQLGRGNWWESSSSTTTTTSSSRNNKFESGILSSTTTTMSSVSTALNSMANNFGCWQTEFEDIKAKSSLNPMSVSGSDNSSMVFPADSQKLHASESSVGGGVLSGGPNLQIVGLGLSSQGLDWNQPFL